MPTTTANEDYLDSTLLERMGVLTEQFIQKGMEKIGWYCASNPWFVLFIGKKSDILYQLYQAFIYS